MVELRAATVRAVLPVETVREVMVISDSATPKYVDRELSATPSTSASVTAAGTVSPMLDVTRENRLGVTVTVVTVPLVVVTVLLVAVVLVRVSLVSVRLVHVLVCNVVVDVAVSVAVVTLVVDVSVVAVTVVVDVRVVVDV